MTAVEWLVKQLNQKIDFIPLDKWDMIRDIVIQAKEMEKQQIIEAHGLIAKLQEDGSHKLISGETYYDETYKSTNK
jgi:succinate dehydrogenase/fumarate reductase-like Fe-S protein